MTKREEIRLREFLRRVDLLRVGRQEETSQAEEGESELNIPRLHLGRIQTTRQRINLEQERPRKVQMPAQHIRSDMSVDSGKAQGRVRSSGESRLSD